MGKMDGEKKTKPVRVDREVIARFDSYCKANGYSRKNMIEKLMKDFMARKK